MACLGRPAARPPGQAGAAGQPEPQDRPDPAGPCAGRHGRGRRSPAAAGEWRIRRHPPAVYPQRRHPRPAGGHHPGKRHAAAQRQLGAGFFWQVPLRTGCGPGHGPGCRGGCPGGACAAVGQCCAQLHATRAPAGATGRGRTHTRAAPGNPGAGAGPRESRPGHPVGTAPERRWPARSAPADRGPERANGADAQCPGRAGGRTAGRPGHPGAAAGSAQAHIVADRDSRQPAGPARRHCGSPLACRGGRQRRGQRQDAVLPQRQPGGLRRFLQHRPGAAAGVWQPAMGRGPCLAPAHLRGRQVACPVAHQDL